MGSLAPALDLWAAGAHVSPQAKIAQGAYGVVGAAPYAPH